MPSDLPVVRPFRGRNHLQGLRFLPYRFRRNGHPPSCRPGGLPGAAQHHFSHERRSCRIARIGPCQDRRRPGFPHGLSAGGARQPGRAAPRPLRAVDRLAPERAPGAGQRGTGGLRAFPCPARAGVRHGVPIAEPDRGKRFRPGAPRAGEDGRPRRRTRPVGSEPPEAARRGLERRGDRRRAERNHRRAGLDGPSHRSEAGHDARTASPALPSPPGAGGPAPYPAGTGRLARGDQSHARTALAHRGNPVAKTRGRGRTPEPDVLFPRGVSPRAPGPGPPPGAGVGERRLRPGAARPRSRAPAPEIRHLGGRRPGRPPARHGGHHARDARRVAGGRAARRQPAPGPPGLPALPFAPRPEAARLVLLPPRPPDGGGWRARAAHPARCARGTVEAIRPAAPAQTAADRRGAARGSHLRPAGRAFRRPRTPARFPRANRRGTHRRPRRAARAARGGGVRLPSGHARRPAEFEFPRPRARPVDEAGGLPRRRFRPLERAAAAGVHRTGTRLPAAVRLRRGVGGSGSRRGAVLLPPSRGELPRARTGRARRADRQHDAPTQRPARHLPAGPGSRSGGEHRRRPRLLAAGHSLVRDGGGPGTRAGHHARLPFPSRDEAQPPGNRPCRRREGTRAAGDDRIQRQQQGKRHPGESVGAAPRADHADRRRPGARGPHPVFPWPRRHDQPGSGGRRTASSMPCRPAP